MATPNLLRENFTIEDGQDRAFGTELWHVSAITGFTNDSQGVAQVINSIGRALNSAHPDPGLASLNCRLQRRRIVRLLRSDGSTVTDALVMLCYDTRRYGFNVTASSRIRGRLGMSLRIPKITRILSGGTGFPDVYAIPEPDEYEFGARRGEAFRTIYRQNLTGDDATLQTLADAIELNIGKIYGSAGAIYTAGRPFLLMNYSGQAFNNGRLQIVYEFYSNARVLAVAGGTVPGYDITLPALDYLDEYSVNAAVFPPVIGVITVFQQYGLGTALP